MPYRLRDDFLSPAELSFYRALFDAVGNSAIIAPKVNLADIFFVINRKENFAFHGRISQKHVDFLLYDAQTLRPLAAVELDDASHRRSDRQARDAWGQAEQQHFCAEVMQEWLYYRVSMVE